VRRAAQRRSDRLRRAPHHAPGRSTHLRRRRCHHGSRWM
jgi:hypothetical protein